MDTIVKIDVIKEYILINKLSKQQFCKMCRISVEVLNKILNGKINFRIKALFKIAKVININVCKLFN